MGPTLDISKKLLLAFGVTFGAVVLTGGAVFVSQSLALKASHLNTLSNTIVDDVDRALGGLHDQNASIRGLVLYKLQRYVDKFDAAGKLVDSALADARKLARDNPDVLTQIDRLSRAAKRWQDDIGNPSIALGRDPATIDKAMEIAASEFASVRINEFRDASARAR